MKKMLYYAILVALFISLWFGLAMLFALIFHSSRNIPTLAYCIGVAAIFGIFGALRECIKTWMKKKGWI